MEVWQQVLLLVGSIIGVYLAYTVVKTAFPFKTTQRKEKGTEMMEMAALGECSGDECQREETCFGCPPEGPDVALDQDPNRFLEGPEDPASSE